jgi:hypothetical protein
MASVENGTGRLRPPPFLYLVLRIVQWSYIEYSIGQNCIHQFVIVCDLKRQFLSDETIVPERFIDQV